MDTYLLGRRVTPSFISPKDGIRDSALQAHMYGEKKTAVSDKRARMTLHF